MLKACNGGVSCRLEQQKSDGEESCPQKVTNLQWIKLSLQTYLKGKVQLDLIP
jgi:hypothetical protein